jgi:Na+-driven multidrug efflux pump
MIVSAGTVLLNMLLAPFLIFGWWTGHAFGVAGAAVSSLVAVAVGVVWYAAWFVGPSAFLRFVPAEMRPRLDLWKRLLAIGLPAGFEFGMMSLYLIVVYAVSRPFGAAAQAGFGIGQRVVQAGFMPVVALAFSVAPVAGQAFGARMAERVRETFRQASVMAAAMMLALAIVCSVAPAALLRVFTSDPAAIAVGVDYLRIISWNFVASGVIFVASSMFQAMGNTIPSLVTSAVRMAVIVVPVLTLSRLPGFQLRWVWYLTVAAVFVGLAVCLLLLRREYRRRLAFDEPVAAVPIATEVAAV